MRKLYMFIIVVLPLMGFNQDKSIPFGTVYVSELQSDDSWSDLKKTSYSLSLKRVPMDGSYSYMAVMDVGNEEYSMSLSYQTQTGDDKAFHEVGSGAHWPSKSGATRILGVLAHKNIEEIYADGNKPFDLEIKYLDGSAVKYYFSM